MNNTLKSSAFILLFIALLIASSSIFVITEGQTGMLLYLGKIVKSKDKQIVELDPGLHFKYPFINNVKIFDTRLQTLDLNSERVMTKEKKDVIVDYFVKWRIDDIATYYKSTNGNKFDAEKLLQQLLNSPLRAEFGRRTVSQVVSGGRADVMNKVLNSSRESAKSLGINIIDVRIKRVDLPETISESIYERMAANRKTKAKKHRGDGRGSAQAIRAEADKNVTIIISKAKSQGETIRAQGQKEAAEIYAKAYGKDPSFFAFYRSLIAYQGTFKNKNDILILNQKGQFFDYFQKSTATPATKKRG